MKVTTSRSPSAKSRRLGKALAGFLSIPYENRGKQSLTEEEDWLVVVEDHGDPHGFIKRCQGVEEQMTFRLSMEPKRVHLKKMPAMVTGERDEARSIARFFGLDWSGDSAPKRIVAAASEQIDFIDEGEVVFRLKLC